MPSLRRHIITGEPIVFAPDRAQRPNAFGTDETGLCPFCPGREDMTPPELERVGDPWRVRVFPNKYPSVEQHEVIVESPEHGLSFEALPHAAEVVEAYMRRYRAHSESAFVALFSNHGRRAGASIAHLHSQLMALPFVPPRVARETAAFANADRCPLCAAAEEHARGGLVIDRHGGFSRIAPSGSSHPYEQWVVPDRHHRDMSGLNSEEVEGLASMLRQATGSTHRITDSYNVLFMNFGGERAAHFYVSVIPRLSMIAGFELATGTFIDIIDPAAAARALR